MSGSAVAAMTLAMLVGAGACSSDKDNAARSSAPPAAAPTAAAPTAAAPTATPPATAAATADKREPSEEKRMPEERKTIALSTLSAATQQALHIEVPVDFAVEQATADFVRLKSPGLSLIVEVPAEGVASLDDERGLLGKRGVTEILVEALADGEAIAYRADGKHYAIVARPALGVLCSGAELTGEDDARRVVALCKTLRAAP